MVLGLKSPRGPVFEVQKIIPRAVLNENSSLSSKSYIFDRERSSAYRISGFGAQNSISRPRFRPMQYGLGAIRHRNNFYYVVQHAMSYEIIS